MSKEVDEKVVQMRFDNKNFEKNCAQSMSTLDKLKEKLSFKGVTKGVKEVNSAMNNVDFSGFTRGVNGITAKFSYMQMTVQHQLNRIVDSAVNAGKRITSALTIDPIKAGFQEYETQMNSVQTILANTRSEGTTVKDVNKALDELNTYADKTIYNFTEMTRNIGTFTAAGVKLNTSVNAIQGIANLAAVSGSTSQQASTAMYQLSQALAAGTVKLMDWNSVVNAGMGGQVFQDALKETSRELGTGVDAAIKKMGSFRESLSQEWLTAEVLTKTLKKFTTSGANEYVAKYTGLTKEAVEQEIASAKAKYGEANAIKYASKALAKKSGKNEKEIKDTFEFAQTAEDAATKVKTFTQLIDTLKEALGSGWTQTWRLVLGDFEEAKELFTSISDFLGGMINKSAEVRNAIVGMAMSNPFYKMAKAVEKANVSVKEITKATKDLGSVVDKVINGEFGNGEARFKALTKAGYNWKEVQNGVNEKLGVSYRYMVNDAKAKKETEESTAKLIERLIQYSDAELKSMGYNKKQIQSLRLIQEQSEKTGLSIGKIISNTNSLNGRFLLIDAFTNLKNTVVATAKVIKKAWNSIFPAKSVNEKAVSLYNLIAAFHKWSMSFKLNKEQADNLTRTLKGLFALLDLIRTITSSGLKLAITVLNTVLDAFDMDILDLTANIGDMLVKARDWVKQNNLIQEAIVPLATGLASLIVKIKDFIVSATGINSVTELFTKFKDVAVYIIEGLKNGINDNPVIEFFKNFAMKIVDTVKKVLGIHSPSTVFASIGKFIVEGLWMGIFNSLAWIIDKVKLFGVYIVEAFKSSGMNKVAVDIKKVFDSIKSYVVKIDFKKFLAIIPIGTVSTIAVRLSKVANAFADGIGSINGVIDNFALVEQSLSKTLNAFGRSLNAKAFLRFAIAIGVLAAACIAISYADQDNLYEAVGVVTVLAGVLLVFATLANKIASTTVTFDRNAKSFTKLKDNILMVGLAILSAALAVKMLGSMSERECEQGLQAAAAILSGLVIFMAAARLFSRGGSLADVDKVGKMLRKIAVAILILILDMKLIGKLDSREITKGIIFIGAFGLLAKSLISVAKSSGNNVSKAGTMLIKMGIALAILVGVCKLIGTLSVEDIGKGIVFMAAFILFTKALVSVTKIGKRQEIAKVSGIIRSFGVSMILLAAACKILDTVSLGGMAKGVTLISLFSSVLVTLIEVAKLGNEQTMGKISGMMISMSISIGILAFISTLLGMVPLNILAKGVTAVSVLGLIIAAMVAACRNANNSMKNIIALTVAIGVLTVCVATLSMLDTTKLVSAAGGLSAALVSFAAVLNYANNIKADTKSLIAICAVIVILTGALYLLAQVPSENAISSATAMSEVLLALSGSMKLLNDMKELSSKALASIAAIAGIALIMGAVIKFISTSDPVGALASATAMSILLIALTGSIKLLGSFDGLSRQALTSLTQIAMVMAALGVVLRIISGLDPVGALAATVAISVLLYSLIGAMKILSKGGIREISPKEMIALGSYAAVVAVLGVILAAISKIDPVKGLAASVAMSGFILAFGLMTKEMHWTLNIINDSNDSLTKSITSIAKLLIVFMAMGTLIKCLSNVLKDISDLDPKKSIGNATALSEIMLAMSGCLALLSSVPLAGAVKGIVGFTAFVAALTGIIVALGALTQVDGFTELVDSGGAIFIKLGKILAKCIGGIIEVLAAVVVKTLPAIGKAIGKFVDGMVSGITSVKKIDKGVLDGAKYLAGAIALICAVKVLSLITKVLTFGESFFGFGLKMSAFMAGAKGFIKGLKGVNPTLCKAGESLAKTMLVLTATKLAHQMSNWLTGGISLDDFGEDLSSFGVYVAEFAKSTKNITDADARKAAIAAAILKTLAEASQEIPNSGGLLGDLVGENDLGPFADQFPKLATGIKGFSENLGDLGKQKIKALKGGAEVVKAMAEAASEIPNEGGVWADLVGDNKLDTFASEFPKVGEGIKGFSDKIGAMADDKMKALKGGAECVKIMAEAASEIPNEGGVWAKLTGDNKVGDFAEQFPDVGIGIAGFASAVSKINDKEVAAIEPAMNVITEFASKADDFATARTSVDDFQTVLANLTKYLASFTGETGLGKVNLDDLRKAADAIRILEKAIASMVDIDTAGPVRFNNALDKIKNLDLGNLAKISKEASGNASAASDAIEQLSYSFSAISNIHGKNLMKSIDTFKTAMSKIKNLSFDGFKDLSETIDVINSNKTAVFAVSDMINSIRGVNLKGLTLDGFKTALDKFTNSKTGICTYFNLFPVLTDDALKRIEVYKTGIDKVKTLIEDINKIKYKGTVTHVGSFKKCTSALADVSFERLAGRVSTLGEETVQKLETYSKMINELAKAFQEIANIKTKGTTVSTFKKKVDKLLGIKFQKLKNITVKEETVNAVKHAVTNTCAMFNSIAGISTKGLSIHEFKKKVEAISEINFDGLVLPDKSTIEANASAISSLAKAVKQCKDISSSKISGLQGAIDSLYSICSKNVKNVQKVFTDTYKSFVTIGKNILSKVAEGMKLEGGDDGKTSLAVTRAYNASIALAKKFRNENALKSAARSGRILMNSFGSGITAKTGSLGKTVRTVVASLVTIVKSYYSSMYQAGQFVIEGLEKGINDKKKVATVKKAGSNLGNAAKEGAKKATDEHSPSKEFYKIGAYCGEGMINGINAYQKKSYMSGASIGDYARKGLSKTIEAINDTLNSGIETQPTIRPLVDMSEVTSSAKLANSLFANSTSIKAATRLPSLMKNVQIQNGNEDVVKAVNALRNDISNLQGNVTNINGITYSGDDDISNAVSQLVRAARIERRR